MKRSGKTNRAEPTQLNWIDKFPGCAELFENAGWLNLFKNIDGYNTVGLREDPGSILLSLHQQQTHNVGPFSNNLRTGCSLTQNSYGMPQN